MTVTTIREEPFFRKWCFCLPLRLCLQTWACLKMLADILVLIYLGYVGLIVLFLFGMFDRLGALLPLFFLLGAILLSLIVDVGFLMTLAVGIAKKSIRILRVFYYYELYAMTVEALIIATMCTNMMSTDMEYWPYTAIGLLYIVLDVCICITIKSEIIKLRNKEQFDFSKLPVCADEGTGKLKGEQVC